MSNVFFALGLSYLDSSNIILPHLISSYLTLPIYLSIYLPIYLSTYIPIHPSIHPSINQSINAIHQSIIIMNMFNMICIIWYIYISNDDIHIELSMFLVASGQQRSSYPGHEGGRGAAFAALKNMENPRKWRFHRKKHWKIWEIHQTYGTTMGKPWKNHGKICGASTINE